MIMSMQTCTVFYIQYMGMKFILIMCLCIGSYSVQYYVLPESRQICTLPDMVCGHMEQFSLFCQGNCCRNGPQLYHRRCEQGGMYVVVVVDFLNC